MKLERYEELEKIVLKGAKDDYLLFEVSCCFLGILLVFALFSIWGNIPAMILTATGIIVFAIWYTPADKQMQEKIAKRKEIMDEIKRDVE